MTHSVVALAPVFNEQMDWLRASAALSERLFDKVIAL